LARDVLFGASMDKETFEKVLVQSLSPDGIGALAAELGVVERQSKIRMQSLVMALILTARTGGRQADAFKHYRELTGQHGLYRGALYARFTKGLAGLLERLLRDAMAAAASDGLLLPPAFGGVKDWLVRDATTVPLSKQLFDTYPGTKFAGMKVHKTYSLGLENLVQYELSPAREADSDHCPVTEELRGYGLLVDLAYASRDFIERCRKHGVSFVMKLKSNWKVQVDKLSQGAIQEALDGFRPIPLEHHLVRRGLRCVDGILDADASLHSGETPVPVRLVAVEVPGKHTCLFLTNLPRETYPAKLVGDLYRLRWEIENDNKLDKSDWRLDQIDARKPDSVHAMVYASLLGSVLVNRLVHLDHLQLAASLSAGEPMRRGPLHARLVALCLTACHATLTRALADPQFDPDATRRASIVVDCDGRDPNWRNSPSVFDRIHGFVGKPGRPKRQKTITQKGPSASG
jgi:hypothetical protein